MKTKDIYNIDAIKKIAGHDITKGALTDDYPLDLEQTYQLLNEALATEIICVLRYTHHAMTVKGIDYHPVRDEFLEHAQQEQIHMQTIAERIDQLGGNPDFNPASVINNAAIEYTNDRSLMDMLKSDLIAERVAIILYKKLITWFGDKDPTTRVMLESILKQEEDHANNLADFMHANTR
jgi:bacterioferritin